MKQYLLILFAILALTAGCRNGYPELPPATQTGQNTFGCLVNGELVIPFADNKWQNDSNNARYNESIGQLTIQGYGQDNQRFEFTIMNPAEGSKTSFTNVVYYASTLPSNYYYGGQNIGEVLITKFDTNRKIVSGQFSFIGTKWFSDGINTYEADVNDKVIVTMGRFDLVIK